MTPRTITVGAFNAIQCARCHVPSPGDRAEHDAAPSRTPVPLFSDLPSTTWVRPWPIDARTATPAAASGETAPLWGLRITARFLNGNLFLLHRRPRTRRGRSDPPARWRPSVARCARRAVFRRAQSGDRLRASRCELPMSAMSAIDAVNLHSAGARTWLLLFSLAAAARRSSRASGADDGGFGACISSTFRRWRSRAAMSSSVAGFDNRCSRSRPANTSRCRRAASHAAARSACRIGSRMSLSRVDIRSARHRFRGPKGAVRHAVHGNTARGKDPGSIQLAGCGMRTVHTRRRTRTRERRRRRAKWAIRPAAVRARRRLRQPFRHLSAGTAIGGYAEAHTRYERSTASATNLASGETLQPVHGDERQRLRPHRRRAEFEDGGARSRSSTRLSTSIHPALSCAAG